MKLFKEECYEAFTNSDLNEGRGSKVTIGYFKKSTDAERAVKGKGVMGTDGDVKYTTLTVKVFENYQEYTAENVIRTREIALSKLTKEEKLVLGLL